MILLLRYALPLFLFTSLTLATEKVQLKLFDQLTDPKVYDKRQLPASDGPIRVGLAVTVTVLHNLQYYSQDLASTLIMEHTWNDDRLAYEDIPNTPLVLRGGDDFAKKIWKPSVYVVNERRSSVVSVPQPNVLVTVAPNGDVTYTYRVRSNVYCGQDMWKYPFDTQYCRLAFESWSLDTEDLVLEWKNKNGTEITGESFLPEWKLNNLRSYTTSFQRPNGKYFSDLVTEFTLDRRIEFYVVDFYVPGILAVLTQCISFWIIPSQLAARTILSSSPFYHFIMISRFLSIAMPKGGGVKSVDVYSFICFIFMFLMLAELGFVWSIYRRRRKVEIEKLTVWNIIKHEAWNVTKRNLPDWVLRRMARKKLKNKEMSEENLHDLNRLFAETQLPDRLTKPENSSDEIHSTEPIQEEPIKETEEEVRTEISPAESISQESQEEKLEKETKDKEVNDHITEEKANEDTVAESKKEAVDEGEPSTSKKNNDSQSDKIDDSPSGSEEQVKVESVPSETKVRFTVSTPEHDQENETESSAISFSVPQQETFVNPAVNSEAGVRRNRKQRFDPKIVGVYIDKQSRIYFPAAILIFNAAYWCVMML